MPVCRDRCFGTNVTVWNKKSKSEILDVKNMIGNAKESGIGFIFELKAQRIWCSLSKRFASSIEMPNWRVCVLADVGMRSYLPSSIWN